VPGYADLLVQTLLPAVLGAAAVFAAILWSTRSKSPSPVQAQSGTACLLFSGSNLLDANDEALALLNGADTPGSIEWLHLRRAISLRFPDFPKTPDGIVRQLSIPEVGGSKLALQITPLNDALRVEIPPKSPDPQEKPAPNSARPLGAAEYAACPMWCVGASGQVVWGNRAYLSLIGKQNEKPVEQASLGAAFDPRDLAEVQMRPKRVRCVSKQEELWFEVSCTRLGEDVHYTALPLDEVIRAETIQRSFVQTLTKTFANLSIGLAIFDKERRLALFNPALLDLTNLSVDFLTSRPFILGFFDAMRDNQTMPEPKDIREWRQKIMGIGGDAPSGELLETWSLPSGQTFRITGRPHPDGTLAFLIEDITDEISLTRHFRQELKQIRAILNYFDQAVVLFAPNGTLSLQNAAFDTVWPDGETAVSPNSTLINAVAHWRDLCAPSPFWDQLLAYIDRSRTPPPDLAILHRKDGLSVSAMATRLPGGSCLILFATTSRPLRSAPWENRAVS
jgi:hypothetical protein